MRKSFLFLLFIGLSSVGFSQSPERYNWYFGSSNQAIRFNRTSAVPSMVTKSIPFGGGGSVTVSDPVNSNLLFYTDGQFIYDASNVQMPGGFGLTATTASNQPVVVCPVPGQPKKFFVFTSTANFNAGGTISISVVDMNQFGNAAFPAPPLGDVETKNVAMPGLANRAEGMIIIPRTGTPDFWLITQQVNSLVFTTTLIDAASYTGTFTHTNTSATSIPMTAANLAYHEGKGKIAVSPQDSNTDAIILDFNAATGVFGFDRFIFNSGLPTATNQSVYDIEWSQSGDYLYLSRFGEPGVQADLLQYDYLNPTTTLTSVLPAPVFRSFGVQMGPDSTLYHLYQSAAAGPILMGTIGKADTIASQVNYKTAQLTATSLASTQFSSFAAKAQINLIVDFTFIGTCQNTNTIFFPDVQPGADSIRWDFGDMTGSNEWSPVHKFGQAQTFNVQLTAFYQGQTQTTAKPVTITTFPLQLNLVQDTTACRSEFPPPRGTSTPKQFSVKVSVTGGTPVAYTWSNGDTGPTLTPDSAGYYYVVVTDASGCSAYAGVNVKEYGLQDQRANIWFFGKNAGIDFNTLPNPPVALSNSAMNAPEGCAIICDRNGKTIFYTDGDAVYNKLDAQIATGIGGDPLASQSAIIVPVPGDETLYYIFTNEAINGTSTNTVKYSLFDLKQNNGLGAVVKQNVTLFSKGTERITASGKWLIIHEYGNNTFRTYQISATGIGEAVLTAIGSDHSFTSQSGGEGYMKLGPKNNLAVALSQGGANLVELFHLNDTTGKLTNYRKIDLKQATGQVYGVEFSAGGNKLFATVKGPPSQVYEYFIDSLGHVYFKQKITQPSEIGAIQMAPDGQIYMAINNSAVLGTIQATDDTTRLSSVNFSGFALAGGTNSRLGLPNFIQQISNATGGPTFDFTGICLGDSTKFVGTATDAIDMFTWFFGDGGGKPISSDPTAAHLYSAAGTYTASMRLTNRCGLDTTLVKPVTIFNPPAKPTIPPASALCTGPVTLDANTAGTPGLTYLWSGGETTRSIVVNQQTIINVAITDLNGCVSRAQALVADNQPQVDLGPDLTLCQNALTLALDAQNPGANYSWTVNGGGTTTAQTRQLDTTVPGSFDYQVIVTDPVTTCTKTDQATFTIRASPLFTLSGTDPTACLASDGILTLQLQTTAPPTGPYSYFATGPTFNQQAVDQLAPQTVNFNALPAGIYSVVVNDQISGCTISQSFGLTDAPFTATALPKAPNCDPVTITVTTTALPAALPLQYQVTPSGTGTSVGPITGIATPAFDTSPVTAGTYTIQIKDNGGCVFNINNFLVAPNPPVAITVTPSVCSSPPTLTANAGAGATYTWTGPGIVGPANNATVTVSGQGQFTYVVTANSPGNCPNTQNTVVTLDNPLADFTQSDPCQTSIVLSATPTGNYTYRWYKSGTFQPGLLGQQITLGLAENNSSFQTELYNTLNGCAYRSAPPKAVSVLGTVDAGLSSTPACDDDQPFTLTSTTTATGTTYAWFKDNVAISGLTTPVIQQTDEATYKVEISKSTCKANAQLTVVKAPLPVGQLANRKIICNDPENKDPKTNNVDLDPGNFISYNWFKNDLSINYTQRIFNATSQGKYRVDLTNSFGCVASDETDVRSECIPRIDVPNAFRPTSTISENKEFYAFTFFITDENFQVLIYNRWGELVFTSTDRNFKWNGGYNNNLSQPVPGGSYAYIIRYVSSFHPERGTLEKRGGVALLR